MKINSSLNFIAGLILLSLHCNAGNMGKDNDREYQADTRWQSAAGSSQSAAGSSHFVAGSRQFADNRGQFDENMKNRAEQPEYRGENRKPIASGTFYPSGINELRNNLHALFEEAESRDKMSDIMALIVPHAGYVYSGMVAASGYQQLNPDKTYKRIFLIGSSHRAAFEGASIYAAGHYETPLGRAMVDQELAGQLIQKHDCFHYYQDAHQYEHSLEVQLPFLQYYLNKPFKIVPIILGTQQIETCREIGTILREHFTEENLFIISTDFSHYPPYEQAKQVDKNTAQAIMSKKPSRLIDVLDENAKQDILNLQTSLCGWSSVLSFLYLLEDFPDIEPKEIMYKNSGDSDAGSKDQVVGYYSIAFSHLEEKTFQLNDEEKQQLLVIARQSIKSFLNNEKLPLIPHDELSKPLKEPCGAFVTLHKDGALRGCIGNFTAKEPLYKIVRKMAISAAIRDPRFPCVDKDEVDDLEIEISVLTPLKKINDISEFQLGKHGIYIKKGNVSGTLLPQVAETTGWTREEFIGHCARDKAGLGWDGWKDAELFTYEAFIFSEETYGKKQTF